MKLQLQLFEEQCANMLFHFFFLSALGVGLCLGYTTGEEVPFEMIIANFKGQGVIKFATIELYTQPTIADTSTITRTATETRGPLRTDFTTASGLPAENPPTSGLIATPTSTEAECTQESPRGVYLTKETPITTKPPSVTPEADILTTTLVQTLVETRVVTSTRTHNPSKGVGTVGINSINLRSPTGPRTPMNPSMLSGAIVNGLGRYSLIVSIASICGLLSW